MGGWLRQSTEVTKRIGPFVDKTDAVTPETGLAGAGTEISKAGAAYAAGPTLGTHDADGHYPVTWTATHTNTLGTFAYKVHDSATHLPVWDDTWMVLPAAVYDSLVAGTDVMPADVTQWLGTAAATPDTAGVPHVNTVALGNTTQTARDLGAGVKIGDEAHGGTSASLTLATSGGSPALSISSSSSARPVQILSTSVASAVFMQTASGHGVEIYNPTNGSPVFLRSKSDGSVPALRMTGGDVDVVAVTVAGNMTAGNITTAGTIQAGTNGLPWNASWDAEVQSEVDDALVAHGLDHLIGASVTGTDVADNSIAARLVSASATADWDDYDQTTDSAQAIRDRGDSAWTTGGTPPHLLQNTTIATLASQTSFTLTAGSADDDAYNGAVVVVTDQATSAQKAVGEVSDYTGATKTITLAADPGIFTMATGDTIDVMSALGSIDSVPTAVEIRTEMDSSSTKLAFLTGNAALESTAQALVTTVGTAGAGLTESGGTGDQFTGIPTVATVTTVTNSGNATLGNNAHGGAGATFTLASMTASGNITAGNIAAAHVGDTTGNTTGSLSGSVGSVTGAVGSVAGNVDGSTASVTGTVGGIAGTIQTLDALDTAQDTQHGTTQTAVAALPTLAEMLAGGDVDGYTLEETLKLCLAACAAKLSGAATTTITIRAADDSKARITATVDADGNRSAVTLDATG